MPNDTTQSRRRFLKRAAAAAGASLAAPYVIPSGVLAAPGRPGANDRIIIGFIGAGGRAKQLMAQMVEPGRIVAICDCYLPRAREASQLIGDGKWKTYQNYHKMIESEKLDAVVIPVTDHGRVLAAIAACQAGLDVYAEKPLTVSIGEGRALVKIARKHKRVFQVGSQQRSMEMNRYACELVRKGALGKNLTVRGCNYTGPRRYTGLPKEKIPDGLDWDMWCGATELRPYNRQLQFGWMGWRSYSGGEMTNWGAHGIDQIQWALGMSRTGPVEVWPVTPGPNGKVSMRYANGVVVKLEIDKGGPMGGAQFSGDDGKIRIDRNGFLVRPDELAKDRPGPEVAKVWAGEGLKIWNASLHMKNWLDCIRTRAQPVADVEIGHRSISVCHLANIAREAGRKLQWDPAKETFVGDDEANRYLNRPRRKGYELPTSA